MRLLRKELDNNKKKAVNQENISRRGNSECQKLELGISLDNSRDGKEASETQARGDWYMTGPEGTQWDRGHWETERASEAFVFFAMFQV